MSTVQQPIGRCSAVCFKSRCSRQAGHSGLHDAGFTFGESRQGLTDRQAAGGGVASSVVDGLAADQPLSPEILFARFSNVELARALRDHASGLANSDARALCAELARRLEVCRGCEEDSPFGHTCEGVHRG